MPRIDAESVGGNPPEDKVAVVDAARNDPRGGADCILLLHFSVSFYM
jgi:hypothetical protein